MSSDAPAFPEGPQPMNIPVYPWGSPMADELCYLDSENSILCAYCALESNSLDEVPQFRPVQTAEPFPSEHCDQCSRLLLEEEE